MACEGNCFTFTWKLENISYCLQKQNRVIKSPAFVVDSFGERKWYLGLYPRGQEYEDFISFALYKELDSKKTVQREIKYELAFVGKDGSFLRRISKYDFSDHPGHGFSDFAGREEVFDTKRSIFLPHDILTARCRIWKTDGELAESIRCFAHTRIGVEKRSFMWKKCEKLQFS
ncbi:unnamed protein product [Larinioides sclopetarius]|uniref:MATH domain-containing protein n=1 Tax=Larinioides sclopetarius TaxID=280406 RepID=A0AAV2BH19_9ARAC